MWFSSSMFMSVKYSFQYFANRQLTGVLIYVSFRTQGYVIVMISHGQNRKIKIEIKFTEIRKWLLTSLQTHAFYQRPRDLRWPAFLAYFRYRWLERKSWPTTEVTLDDDIILWFEWIQEHVLLSYSGVHLNRVHGNCLLEHLLWLCIYWAN